MKKKFLKYLSVLSAFICIIITLSVSFFYYNIYQKNEINNVKDNGNTLSGVINNGNPIESLKNINSGDMRITLIGKDGNVLFDTDADANTLDNHSSRTEVKQALEKGNGESKRYSETIKKYSYYYAIKLNNGSVLRVSKSFESGFNLFVDTVPFLLLLIIFFVLISNFIAKILTEKIIEPINKASKQLDGILTEDYIEFEELSAYDEFLPFIRKIKYLNKEIRNYTKLLKSQNNTLDTITSNMQEGLVLLDPLQYVLSVNDSAKAVITSNVKKDYKGQQFISLCRNSKVLDAVSYVIKTKSNTYVDIEANNQYYKYFFSPVLSDSKKIRGVIIFIVNATIEMKNAKMRRDFASNVSHELKTPLTSINGFAEMLKSSMIENKEDIIKTSAMIYKESSRLITLVEDIIRLSQIESGAMSEAQDTDFEALIKEVTVSLTPVAQSKNVTLKAETSPIIIKANPSMLYELAYNLCENAIKYNKPDGKVQISLNVQNDKAVLTVSDTGIGIAPEHISRIYERFYRIDKSRSKQTGGTGLGLSIVKHIVESLNGTINTQSEIDKGTVITVIIPLQ